MNVNQEVDDAIAFFTRNKDFILGAWGAAEGDSPYAFNYQQPDGWFMKMMARAIPNFSGKTVLDVGCNSGLNSLITAFSAEKVIGCDIIELFISRADAAKRALSRTRDFSNVDFRLGDFRKFLQPEVNGMIAARILYHIADDGVEALKDFISQRDSFTLLVHTRPGRAKVRTTAYNGLIELADLDAFFADTGMKAVGKWGGGSQVFVLATKG